jgi:hypothetical protein
MIRKELFKMSFGTTQIMLYKSAEILNEGIYASVTSDAECNLNNHFVIILYLPSALFPVICSPYRNSVCHRYESRGKR